MKRFAKASVVVGVLWALVSGCGVGMTRQDNVRQFKRSADYDSRMLVDDVRVFLLADRPFRGSRVPIE